MLWNPYLLLCRWQWLSKSCKPLSAQRIFLWLATCLCHKPELTVDLSHASAQPQSLLPACNICRGASQPSCYILMPQCKPSSIRARRGSGRAVQHARMGLQ